MYIAKRILISYIILAFFLSGCQVSSLENNYTIDKSGKGLLLKINGNLVLYIKGTPYEMGYQRGILLKDNIQGFIEKFFKNMNYSQEDILKFYQSAKFSLHQDIIQELKGIADGSGVSFEDIIVANLLIDKSYLSCGSLVVFDKSTKNTQRYQVRTLDWNMKVGIEDNWVIVVYQPKGALRYAIITTNGLIYTVTGINEKGLAIDAMLFETQDSNLTGTPVGFLIHEVLRKADSVSSAISIIRSAKRTTGVIYTVSNGYCSVILETTAEKMDIFNQDRFDEQTSNYAIPIAYAGFRTALPLSPSIKLMQKDYRNPFERVVYHNIYKRIAKFVKAHYGQLDKNLLIKLTKIIAIRKNNLLNIVYLPRKLDFWVAFSKPNSPAYKNRYIHYNLKSLIKTYERDNRSSQ